MAIGIAPFWYVRQRRYLPYSRADLDLTGIVACFRGGEHPKKDMTSHATGQEIRRRRRDRTRLPERRNNL